MCGIAGIASRGAAPIDPWALKPMADMLAHRGPDDAGFAMLQPDRNGSGGFWAEFTDPGFRHSNEHLPVLGDDYSKQILGAEPFSVGLAHRRLSILDLSFRGHQPMNGRDRRYWIVHNGEVYNFQELRAELEKDGAPFQTTTDTEVILRLWEREGPGCINRFDGMFAFAIYDRIENELFIVRDRFGVKPVYFAVTADHLAFASEAKALFASGMVPAAIRPEGLIEYCTFQNTLGSRTIWEQVELLPAGHFLRFKPGTSTDPDIKRYFDGFPDSAENGTTIDAESPRVATAFQDAVTRQLVSDVPVGSYLSGGMDSGSIVAAAGRSIPRLHTFTGGFDLTNVNGIEQGFDERALAEQLSYLLQTEHYAVVLHAGDMPAAMEQITWHMDDPRVGMCHQNWYVAKLSSKFVKVCLAGTGGDELFAGYPWRYRPGLTAPDEATYEDALFHAWHRLLPHDELANLFTGDMLPMLESGRESFDTVMAGCRKGDTGATPEQQVLNRIRRTLEFEFRTFLNGLLVTDDHISMAHSLETRVPFLDNALADLSWSLPASVKIDPSELTQQEHGHIESSGGKKVLRQAMESLLPHEFVTQRKQGFSPPDANWYRGPSMDYIKSILLDKQTIDRPWFDQDFVSSCLDQHFEGERNHRLLIWSLLSVEWIQRHFADQCTSRQTSAVIEVAGMPEPTS